MASPELDSVIAMLRASPRTGDVPPVEARAHLEAMCSVFEPPGDLRCTPIEAGGARAEWIVPEPVSRARTLLYLHGGGYMVGSPNTHRDLTQRLARAADARVLSVDYRLAPEHPFPAAVDDAVAAYRFLLRSDVPPARIAIAGDSAGGGLTVATLLALREAGDPLPAAGVCLSPWTDLAGTGESMRTKVDEDPMCDWPRLSRMAAFYLGEVDPRTPLASPLYADLRGLPPLLIQVGTAETLLDDATRLAERARAAGVDVALEVWPDMIHVFQAFAMLLPEARDAIDRIGGFLRQRWN